MDFPLMPGFEPGGVFDPAFKNSADYSSGVSEDWIRANVLGDKNITPMDYFEDYVEDSLHKYSDTSSSASDPQALDMASLIRDLNSMENKSAETAYERQKELLSLSGDINSALAKEAFDRTMEADSTKVQRYVADMKKAGINPIIAFSAGMPSISSPSSSAASGSVGSVAKASTLGESAIGKKETLVQGYVGMIAQLLGTAISSAGNVVSSAVSPLRLQTFTTGVSPMFLDVMGLTDRKDSL